MLSSLPSIRDYSTLLYIFLFLNISINCKKLQRILEGPSDVSVKLGDSVLLKCQVEHQVGAVQWLKNGFGLAIDRERSTIPSFRIEGSVSKGEYHLRILNVSISDDDIYECQVRAAGDQPTRKSQEAKLTVLAEPQFPVLWSHSDRRKLIANQHSSYACKSKSGKPASVIGWAITEEKSLRTIESWLGDSRDKFQDDTQFTLSSKKSRNVSITEEIGRDNLRQTFDIISNISYTPIVDDDGKYLTCIISHITYSSLKSVSISLDINYPPIVRIKVNERSILSEGGSAIFHCTVEAKPMENIEIVWRKNGNIIPSAKADVFSIQTLTMDQHLAEYRCTARNNIGESSDFIVLNITYGARIMSTEQHREVNLGETVEFKCETIGNPIPSVVWTKVGNADVIARGANLIIELVQSWQAGEYNCQANVPGFPPAQLLNFLHIKGPPSVSVREELIVGSGDNVELICEVRGRPQPIHVNWTLNGSPVEYGRSNGRIQIHQVPKQFGIESKLILENVREKDFGDYNCVADNEHGTDSQTIRLKASTFLLALMSAMSGVPLIAIIFASILMILILLCFTIWQIKHRPYKRASTYQDDPTIKVEPVDGGPYPFATVSIPGVTFSDNYMSAANNSDFDYIMSSPKSQSRLCSHGSCSIPPMTTDYLSFDDSSNNRHIYGSFLSEGSTPSNLYSYNNTNKFVPNNSAHLGTLREASREMEFSTIAPQNHTTQINDRSDNWISTHV